MKANRAEMTPQLNMMRAIQSRAPNLSSARLDGTSNRKYEMKNKPAPKPYAASESPSAEFICSLAKPTFTRSRYATK
jgi:hypothetical protein